LNQQWIWNKTTAWIQYKTAPMQRDGMVPIPACLTAQYVGDDFGGTTMQLLRAPCDGGNATGLNPVQPLNTLSPFQQWFFNDIDNIPGTIANVVEDQTEVSWCVGISLSSAHWSRASEPSRPSASGKSSYLSVKVS
jgi:hypothetical protein